MKSRELQSISVTSFTTAATAGTNIAGTILSGRLAQADLIVVDAVLVGATGGTLDITLQRQTGSSPNDWTDWCRFPLVSAGAAAARFGFSVNGDGLPPTMQTLGGGNDATPGVAMTAGTYSNIMPGGALRIVVVSGASTSAGGAQKITITPYTEQF